MAAGRLAGAVAVALLGLLAGACNTPSPSIPQATQGSALDATACATLIRAVDLASDDSVFGVDRCRFTAAGAEAASSVLAANASGDARWAALWVYASAGSDPAPLRPYLTSDDPTSRVMAAAAVVAFGDRSGFDALAAAIGVEDQLAGSKPPVSIGAFAAGALASSIDGDEIPTDEAAWPAWLAAHAASLGYDDSAATWRLP